MSEILHIDPFGGAAGDMLLGALLDAGADEAQLREILAGLNLAGFRLEVVRDRQQGFAGTRAVVHADPAGHPARHFADVERLLGAAALPEAVRARALAAFAALFAAESAVHGVPLAETHLHELAAIDAVIDIVGVIACVELLHVTRVSCGPVPVGSGSVQTQHGLLPVPPPAVAKLLEGIPIAGYAAVGEMTTPTGATLLRTIVEEFSPLPGGTVRRIGIGLGRRKFEGIPNLLRVFLISPEAESLAGRPMVLVETTVDDLSGEVLGHLTERLREAGAADAWCMAGIGRKGRPITELKALVSPEAADRITALLFAEGATLGLRMVPCTRPELHRSVVLVATPYGEIPVKVGVFQDRKVSAKPEHDACAAAARAHGVALAVVVEAARDAFGLGPKG